MRACDLDDHLGDCPNELIPCNACHLVKVPRKYLKQHLSEECPKGQQECEKCHGIYKASDDEHCCISHLYKLITINKQVASDDRNQVNDGFQQLNQSVQHTIQALNTKFQS